MTDSIVWMREEAFCMERMILIDTPGEIPGVLFLGGLKKC